MSWNEKNQYVANLCQKHQMRNEFGDRNRHVISYHLEKDGEMLKVCSTFFLRTIALGAEKVKRILMIRKSKRQHNKPTENNTQKNLEKWLDSLPKAPSHYCRANTNKLYLTDEFESRFELFRAYQKYVI